MNEPERRNSDTVPVGSVSAADGRSANGGGEEGGGEEGGTATRADLTGRATDSSVEAYASDPVSRMLRRLITWSVWFGATFAAGVFLVLVLYAFSRQTWLLDRLWLIGIVQQHFAAVIGLPFASLGAFAVVTVLQSTSGPLEFEGLTFKFKGASGPAVLWIACFLAIAAAVKVLW